MITLEIVDTAEALPQVLPGSSAHQSRGTNWLADVDRNLQLADPPNGRPGVRLQTGKNRADLCGVGLLARALFS
ncbi:MAG: hypothetical protein K2W95_23505 [Candidatus Obscuribacterales bacterium]|nr:hypothetical protein [Candidatus Obscuribacterales bacterium]